jgi:hypothetical protein
VSKEAVAVAERQHGMIARVHARVDALCGGLKLEVPPPTSVGANGAVVSDAVCDAVASQENNVWETSAAILDGLD